MVVNLSLTYDIVSNRNRDYKNVSSNLGVVILQLSFFNTI